MKNMLFTFLFAIIFCVTSYFSFGAGFIPLFLFILLSILIGAAWVTIIEKASSKISIEKLSLAIENRDKYGKNKILIINVIGFIAYTLLAIVFLIFINSKVPIFGDAADRRVNQERLADELREIESRNSMNDIKLQRLAREYLSPHLKDPSSAEFRNQKGLCGEVNSNNSFGGKVGYQRFIVGDKSLYVLERDSGISPQKFQDMWNQMCK